jgi:hypothetical protein
MQLDLLLTSIRRHAPHIFSDVTVLYTHDESHMMSYQYVKQEHPSISVGVVPIHWEAERDFEAQVRDWIAGSEDAVTFLVDDAVFYRRALEPEAGELPWAHRHDNPDGCVRWRSFDDPRHAHEEGYPLTVVGTTYEPRTLFPVLDFEFSGVTGLEAGMATRRADFAPEYIYGQREACLCMVNANRVSEASAMPHMNMSVDEMMRSYIDGVRIDLDGMDFSAVESCQTFLPFAWTTAGERERVLRLA